MKALLPDCANVIFEGVEVSQYQVNGQWQAYIEVTALLVDSSGDKLTSPLPANRLSVNPVVVLQKDLGTPQVDPYTETDLRNQASNLFDLIDTAMTDLRLEYADITP